MEVQRKKTVWLLALVPLCALMSGCGKYYLSLTQQKVDASYLSSVHVGTPDPRQAHPPLGEMIIMDWRVPKELLQEHPFIELRVIYWDYTEKAFSFPINKRMGYVTYKDLNEEFTKTQGILTYKADIKTASGKIYKEWKHQLWVNLITLDESPATSSKEPDQVPSLTVDNTTPPSQNPTLEQLQEQELQEQSDYEEEEAPLPKSSSSQQQLKEQEAQEQGNYDEEKQTKNPSLEQLEEQEYEENQPATEDEASTEESKASA